MARLSERVNIPTYTNTWGEYRGDKLPKHTPCKRIEMSDAILDDLDKHTWSGYDFDEKTTNTIKGETNMNTTLRTINLTLVDNNSNLKGEDKIVFQKLNYVTEHNDDQSIQQILMSGDVAKSLEQHNILRVDVVDKEIRRNTGRSVMLEEVEIFDLDWMVVRVA